MGVIYFVTKPCQLADLRTNDFDLFAHLQVRVWRINASSIYKFVEAIIEGYAEYGGDRLEQAMPRLDDDDCGVEQSS